MQARASDLQRALEAASPEFIASALLAETQRRAERFSAGIEAYRQHAYRREVDEPPVIWANRPARLLDFGGPANAPVVVLVPSLINRAYILDLQPRRSFARYLVRRGIRPLLVDWGMPGAREQAFGLDAYIRDVLGGALTVACEAAGRPVSLLGYCMGGLLALPLALSRPGDVSALVAVATPWDFHADGGVQRNLVLAMAGPLRQAIAQFGLLPVDLLQALFAGLDPLLAMRKFTAFATLPPDTAKARDFVALEDWLNDGVPLAGPVAEDCLFGWYGSNATAAGTWQVAGTPVKPGGLAVPLLNVVPSHDRIVPPASALALGAAVSDVTTLRPALGHIGMMASAKAPRSLWPKIANWLRETTPAGAGM